MNKPNILQKLAIAGIASAATVCFPLNANASTFLIDNYNTDLSVEAESFFSDSVVVEPDPGFNFNDDRSDLDLDDWRLFVTAELSTGDRVATRVCAACDNGEIVSDAAASGSSEGFFSFDYGMVVDGTTPIDGTKYDNFMFDWVFADQPGATIELLFDGLPVLDDGPFELPATDTPITYNLPISSINPNVDSITIRFNGVPAIDANFDNAKLTETSVPEPGTVLGLLAVGGLGLGLKRKKQSEKTNQT